MYISFVTSVLVYFSLILSAKGHGNKNGKNEDIHIIEFEDQNVTTNENEKFHFSIMSIDNDIVKQSCIAKCKVNNNIIGASKCYAATENQPPYIDVKMERNLTKQDGGKWNCSFNLNRKTYDSNNTCIPVPETKSFNFQVNIKSVKSSVELNWTKIIIAIGAGIILLALLIIIVQQIWIAYLKKKAKVVGREARWNSMTSSVEDSEKTGNVRYSKMPVQKIKVEECAEARESGIYEVLENIRGTPPVPVPPSLKTLPRKDVCHNSTPPIESPPVEPCTIPRTLANSMFSPLTNSLLRNKNKKPKEPKEPENKRTTIDRIKERPPQPLPDGEEVYEIMENSPLPARKPPVKNEIKKNEVQKKEDFRAFNTGARPKFFPPGQDHVNLGNGAQSLQTKILPSQLKEELRKRVNTVLLEPPKQKNQTLQSAPFSPGPPPAVAPSKSLLPPPVPRTLKSAPSTPVPSKSMIKPPPPVKPKQLHPLPPTPQSRPESIRVITEKCDDDDDDNSDEDWTYEPLPEYPIYSI